jgi:hypothetical protein
MSTTQMIGYVSVTADANPRIKDTSDRERLAEDIAVKAFELQLGQIVRILENERQKDRLERATAAPKVKELFSAVSGQNLMTQVEQVAGTGGSAAQTVPIVRKFQKELEKTRDELERRFVYYSRLAAIGTIAEALVHEIRNRTVSIASFLRLFSEFASEYDIPSELNTKSTRARTSVESLDRLARTFVPLASHNFKRGRRSCNLIEQVNEILDLKQADLDRNRIRVSQIPTRDARINVDPGELSAVFFNLVDNAIYWLSRSDIKNRVLAVRARQLARSSRVEVRVDDSGPGIGEEDRERIFWPGVTAKPDGIGMGLTVVGEIVSAYGGTLQLVEPGYLGGATFQFDVPIVDQ